MKAVVEWLLAQRHRVVLLAMALSPLAPLLSFASSALLALDTARRGVPHGLATAAFAAGGVLLLTVLLGASPSVAVLAAISFVAGVIIGGLLIRGEGSLSAAFQGLVLLTLLGVAVLSLVGPDPRDLLAPAVEELMETMRALGAEEQRLEAMRGWEPMLFGLLAAMVLVQCMVALLLAHWWLGLVDENVRFGEQFRSLRLGRPLGVAALVLVALPLVSDAYVVHTLARLAMVAFLFQGLAVLHAWAHARSWHPLLLAPVYGLLMTPFSVLVSAAGLVDNVFDLRAPLRAST